MNIQTHSFKQNGLLRPSSNLHDLACKQLLASFYEMNEPYALTQVGGTSLTSQCITNKHCCVLPVVLVIKQLLFRVVGFYIIRMRTGFKVLIYVFFFVTEMIKFVEIPPHSNPSSLLEQSKTPLFLLLSLCCGLPPKLGKRPWYIEIE